jgi:antitoxin HicB
MQCEAAMNETDYPFAIRPLAPAEGGGYLIEYPDLPGMSDGETVEEAIANGRDAQAGWIVASEAGRPVPAPGAETGAGYSGKWLLRTPRSLLRSLAERARREGVSLNTLAVALLAEGLGQRQAS